MTITSWVHKFDAPVPSDGRVHVLDRDCWCDPAPTSGEHGRGYALHHVGTVAFCSYCRRSFASLIVDLDLVPSIAVCAECHTRVRARLDAPSERPIAEAPAPTEGTECASPEPTSSPQPSQQERSS